MDSLKERLAEAATYLVHARNYVATLREVSDVINNWENRRVCFAGSKACLNALVELGLSSPEKLQRLYDIVDRKRQGVPSSRRNDYQNQYMMMRRGRMREAIAIEAILEGRPLVGRERKEREARIQADWMKREAEYVSRKGELSYAERNAAKAEFWAIIDRELAAMRREAEGIGALPQHRKKRVVTVVPKPPANPQLFNALQGAKLKRK